MKQNNKLLLFIILLLTASYIVFSTQPKAQQKEIIYGSQLMTQEEIDAFRNKIQQAETIEEREIIRAKHHEIMRVRAKELGMELPEDPPRFTIHEMRRDGGKGADHQNRQEQKGE